MKTVLNFLAAIAALAVGCLFARSADKAPDFDCLIGSDTCSLSHILQRSPFTTIVLFDPDCDTCEAMLDSLNHSSGLARATAYGQVTVLTVCPGEATPLWSRRTADFPACWVNALNPSYSVFDDYPFRSFPALYLVNSDGEMLLSDSSVAALEAYLSEHLITKHP